MEGASSYLMDHVEEEKRLEIKTDPQAVKRQAEWCGLKPGMRVLDAGCGPGRTTSILYDLIQPGGEILGVDYSDKRIAYATSRYEDISSMYFRVHDLRKPLEGVGKFDLIWVRFVLEYNLAESLDIVKNLTTCLNQDGCLCLMDLDYNCLNHYEMPPGTEDVLRELMTRLGKEFNFDAFAGRKLYAYLYDLGYRDIQMDLMAHHLIYGNNLKESDKFNWAKKFEVGAKKGIDVFESFPGGMAAFQESFSRFFRDPRRFTYTPMILCKGKKPLEC